MNKLLNNIRINILLFFYKIKYFYYIGREGSWPIYFFDNYIHRIIGMAVVRALISLALAQVGFPF